MTTPAAPYPVHVDASLDQHLSRWLWLVKWVLAIPHFIVLAFLWLAFAVLSVIAFFAIVATARYPRSIFDFNVGVLRWTWRVQYYTYGALGTDRYPPFTLADDPNYPARLEVDYPAHLSRGLVLVKWWLLAIPHYIIVAVFAGGAWFAWQFGSDQGHWPGGGLISLLVLIAGVVLLFTGRYPEQIFDFVLGMNRWVLRVAAYAGLMTDDYPPFRLDMGGHEPGGTVTMPRPTPSPPGPPVVPGGPPPPPARTGWTAGRIVSVVAGAVLVLSSLGALAAGGVATWADRTQRDASGFLRLGSDTYATTSYAIASDRIHLQGIGADWGDMTSVIGRIRLHVTSSDPTKPVFVGIGPADAVAGYLTDVEHVTVTDIGSHRGYVRHSGSAPDRNPAVAGIWTVSANGTGPQTLTWSAEDGDWTVVAMNSDASAGLNVRVRPGVELPALPWIAGALIVGGVIALIVGALLVALGIGHAARTPAAEPSQTA